jgi:hypothetical protein
MGVDLVAVWDDVLVSPLPDGCMAGWGLHNHPATNPVPTAISAGAAEDGIFITAFWQQSRHLPEENRQSVRPNVAADIRKCNQIGRPRDFPPHKSNAERVRSNDSKPSDEGVPILSQKSVLDPDIRKYRPRSSAE